MMTPRLPFDVVLMIQGELFVWEDDTLLHLYGVIGRRAWLAQVLTISHTWYMAGLPFLYQVIDICPTDEMTLDLLLRTLRKQPQLASLVRVFKPYKREYGRLRLQINSRAQPVRDWERLPILEDMLKDRDKRKNARCMHKIATLARIFINLDELLIDSADVLNLRSALKAVAYRLPRLVLDATRHLKMSELHIADWSNLRSLTLDASQKLEWGREERHKDMYGLHTTSFATMTNLVELEVLGWVWPQNMRDILHILRRTLRSLACNQLVEPMLPFQWLAPVATTLHKLTLFIHADELMCDFSTLSAVKELRIAVLKKAYMMHRVPGASERRWRFPPAVERVEWMFFDWIQPDKIQERIDTHLSASRCGTTPNLHTIAVRFTANMYTNANSWDTLSQALQLQCSERGLNYKMLIDQVCTYFDPKDPRDVFALAVHARILSRVQQAQNREASANQKSRMQRGLARAGRSVVRTWMRCLCVAWCCCCCCPCFRCTHWFL